VVRTPNLDQLAREGLRFTHNYVTTSICGVSRACLFTGQWMSRHGNRAFEMFNTPWAETYPGILRDHGYWVGHVGKWHNGAFPAERFDFSRPYGGTGATHWFKEADGSMVHVTRKHESEALEFLRTRPREKPFCLTLAFFATHAEDRNPLQFLPQPSSMELYREMEIPLPRTATEAHFRGLPPFVANEKNEGRVRWHWRFDTPEKYQSMMKNYYRMATEVDAACGRVLEALRREGVLDDTLVVFTTDNGYFHGEHGLADKWYPYEESIRVPLIIRDPRMAGARQGRTDDSVTLSVDLAPTFLRAAGLAVPAGMQGQDLAPLYTGTARPEWRTEFFYEHPTLRSLDFIPASEALVRKDEKYILWPDFAHEELFDLRTDPFEERTLVADPASRDRLEGMRRRFAELKAAAR
jgi:arylsulfatase A-like enzyme